jgi:hypothetical protein
MNENYEALGRYTKATEEMAKALRERNRLLSELKRHLTQATDSAYGWEAPVHVDFAQTAKLLHDAEAANAQAVAAFNDANNVAALAHKPLLVWR